MGKLIDLTGQTFNRLTVIKRMENDKWGQTRWLCQCECGNKKIIQGNHLKSNRIKSCGCLQKIKPSNLKHGHSSNGIISKTYRTWYSMIQRCNNPNNTRYKDYGGRGIKVCEAWLTFKGFLQDMGERPEGLTLDRIDNSKGYYKENCKWSTQKEQQRNRRNNKLITINGITKCLTEHCKERKLNYWTIRSRLQTGWTSEEALEIIPRKNKNNR